MWWSFITDKGTEKCGYWYKKNVNNVSFLNKGSLVYSKKIVLES